MKKFGFIVCLWVMALGLSGCGKGFSIEFIDDNSVAIVLDKARKQTLWLPLDDKAPEVLITVEGSSNFTEPARVRLSQDSAVYYMPLYLDDKTARINIDGYQSHGKAWDYICLNKCPDSAKKDFRQHIHFTPDIGWMNDPNGMVYFDGEWHLFFQYNPLGARWGNLSWGHAVSRDLVKWEVLPTALYPDGLGRIYSGSAVIDKDNTAGFGKDAMVAVYTSAGKYQTQSIAYSNDNGRTFTKYDGNPVCPSSRADFRDPKVFWHKPTARWIMPLACGNAMEFYSSENLKEWKFESRFGDEYGCHGGEWECPDLIELPYIDGSKWVLLCSLTKDKNHGSSIQYFVGDFDGHTFSCDAAPEHTEWVGYGRDNYAMVTWNNVTDGRTVAIGWQNNWLYGNGNDFPSVGFRGYMTLVYDVRLIEYNGAPRLVINPVKEYDNYKSEVLSERCIEIDKEYNAYYCSENSDALVVECSIDDIKANVVGVKIFNDKGEFVNVEFNKSEQIFSVDRRSSGQTSFNKKFPSVSVAPMSSNTSQSIQIVIDRCSVECFTDITSTSDLVFPSEEYNRISFYTIGGSAVIKDLKISKLNI